MINVMRLCLIVMALGSISLPASAQERIDMEGTSVKGDEENPKVLHLIPWKSPDDAPIIIEPPLMNLDGIMKPVDRPRFRSEIYFRQNRRIGDLP